uniref:Putative secreted protein n=1 Tax=Anopheles darlingi TaxID=43151 RepID=A0A2M4DDT4_ANODA
MLEVDMLLWACLCVCAQQCNWRLACCFGASSSLPPPRRRRRRTQCAEGAHQPTQKTNGARNSKPQPSR